MATTESIIFIYECTINNGQQEAWETLLDDLRELVAGEPGTIAYRSHPASDTNDVCLFEEYADSDAAIAHMGSFGPQYGERFMHAVTMRRVLMLGDPSAELAEFIAPMFAGAMPGLDAAAYGAGRG